MSTGFIPAYQLIQGPRGPAGQIGPKGDPGPGVDVILPATWVAYVAGLGFDAVTGDRLDSSPGHFAFAGWCPIGVGVGGSPTLASGASAIPNSVLAFRRVGRTCFLRGVFDLLPPVDNSTTLLTLPVGFNPATVNSVALAKFPAHCTLSGQPVTTAPTPALIQIDNSRRVSYLGGLVSAGAGVGQDVVLVGFDGISYVTDDAHA